MSIRQFADNWYGAIAQHTESKIALEEKVDALFQAIRQNMSVYDMATSPLLATFIVLINYQCITLLEKRASVYEMLPLSKTG